ncbi:uncharacterized protein LOC8026713 isoform X1 [Ixodes scapularis]|uniref:uncharacterized protein LOC8026713 isoform X1 n=2 Tax=Ixodes scapularis TaxID=6945 RepID=UPI001A9E1046|nr:uncharacterized protein LOC8026713 isoform X1 [Ixodes scapularis]
MGLLKHLSPNITQGTMLEAYPPKMSGPCEAPAVWKPLSVTVAGLLLGLVGTLTFVVGFAWLNNRTVYASGLALFFASVAMVTISMAVYKTQLEMHRHRTQHQYYVTDYGKLDEYDESGDVGADVIRKSGRPGPSPAPPYTIVVLESAAGWCGTTAQPQVLFPQHDGRSPTYI